MSNELPWTRWTPDDLAPPFAEFTPAAIPSDEGDIDAAVPELSEEEQRAQMLAHMQMQAHEQGFNAGLHEAVVAFYLLYSVLNIPANCQSQFFNGLALEISD